MVWRSYGDGLAPIFWTTMNEPGPLGKAQPNGATSSRPRPGCALLLHALPHAGLVGDADGAAVDGLGAEAATSAGAVAPSALAVAVAVAAAVASAAVAAHARAEGPE